MRVVRAEDRQFDERFLRASGQIRLRGIIAPVGAAHGIGLGQAIAERRLRLRELLRQPL